MRGAQPLGTAWLSSGVWRRSLGPPWATSISTKEVVRIVPLPSWAGSRGGRHQPLVTSSPVAPSQLISILAQMLLGSDEELLPRTCDQSPWREDEG